MIHSLFCYGSLINSISRYNTLQRTCKGTTYALNGYKRLWNFHCEKHKMTALGIIPDSKYYVNGILININNDELKQLDIREQGYNRKLINDGKYTFWAYIINKSQFQNKEYPIRSFYYDTCKKGCLEYGQSFFEEFQNTTY